MHSFRSFVLALLQRKRKPHGLLLTLIQKIREAGDLYCLPLNQSFELRDATILVVADVVTHRFLGPPRR